MNRLDKQRIPGFNLYILTDGVFGNPPPNFATPIEIILQKAKEKSNMPSFFSTTIIQFGDDRDARDGLRLLQQSVSKLDGLPPGL